MAGNPEILSLRPLEVALDLYGLSTTANNILGRITKLREPANRRDAIAAIYAT